MPEQNDNYPEVTTEQGVAAFHPQRSQLELPVAPTTGNEFNTVGLDLIPVACLSLADAAFEFDSSFVTPQAGKVLSKLPMLRAKCKDTAGQLPPISVFGHADPTGSDEYNKQLSGRRAIAVYGLITHNTSLWQKLYDQPRGGDDWKTKSVSATMCSVTSMPEGTTFLSMLNAYMTALFPLQLKPGDF